MKNPKKISKPMNWKERYGAQTTGPFDGRNLLTQKAINTAQLQAENAALKKRVQELEAIEYDGLLDRVEELEEAVKTAYKHLERRDIDEAQHALLEAIPLAVAPMNRDEIEAMIKAEEETIRQLRIKLRGAIGINEYAGLVVELTTAGAEADRLRSLLKEQNELDKKPRKE